MSSVDFVHHLQRQLGFLENSCASYDAGHHSEAIRIATVIRVLLHDTGKSTSLLRHLAATDIQLLSTTFDPPSWAFHFMGLGQFGGGRGYVPQLGDGPINTLIPVTTWWNQVVMVIDRTRITRRDLVLGAANKDGGAHVDTNLTAEYEALATDGVVGSLIYRMSDDSEVAAPIQGAHLLSLRQLGYELLHSPALLDLARNS